MSDIQPKAFFRIHDMSNHGRRKGTLMATVGTDQSGGEQLHVTIESRDIKEVVRSAREWCARNGYQAIPASSQIDRS